MDYITVSKLHNKLEGEVNQTTVRKLIDKMTKEGFVEAQSNKIGSLTWYQSEVGRGLRFDPCHHQYSHNL